MLRVKEVYGFEQWVDDCPYCCNGIIDTKEQLRELFECTIIDFHTERKLVVELCTEGYTTCYNCKGKGYIIRGEL